MRRQRASNALQKFKRPFFCCPVQASLSTVNEIVACPVHACSFEGLMTGAPHDTEIPEFQQAGEQIEAQKAIEQSQTHEATGLSKLLAWKTRLEALKLAHTPSSANWIKSCLRNIKEWNKTIHVNQDSCPSSNSADETTVDEKETEEIDREKTAVARINQPLQNSLRYPFADPEDARSLIAAHSAELLDLGASKDFGFTKYRIADCGNPPKLLRSQDIGVSMKYIKVADSRQQNPRDPTAPTTIQSDDMLNTLVFLDKSNGNFSYSRDLFQTGHKSSPRKRRLERFVTLEGECKMTQEKRPDRTVPFMMLRYDLTELSTRVTSASFAGYICVSHWVDMVTEIPKGSTDESTAGKNDDDLWLSMAEDEFSSSSSVQSVPATKAQGSCKPTDHTYDRMATVIKRHQLSFVMDPYPTNSARYEITHATSQMLGLLATDLTRFRRAFRLECLLHQSDLARKEKLSLTVSIGRHAGVVSCTPLYSAAKLRWLCVLLNHTKSPSRLALDPPGLKHMRLESGKYGPRRDTRPKALDEIRLKSPLGAGSTMNRIRLGPNVS